MDIFNTFTSSLNNHGNSQTSAHTPLHYYVETVHIDEDDDLNEEDENGNSSLIFAVISGREDLVRSLVDQGAFVNHQNHIGETALFWGASQGLEKIVDFLIENGANLNISTLDGVSPIHMAATNGHLRVLEKLVRNGAYVNFQDEDRDTALHYAVREGRGEVVDFLINSCGARVDIKNDDLETPLDLAQCLEPCCPETSYSQIIKILSMRMNSPSSSPSFGDDKRFSNFDGSRVSSHLTLIS